MSYAQYQPINPHCRYALGTVFHEDKSIYLADEGLLFIPDLHYAADDETLILEGIMVAKLDEPMTQKDCEQYESLTKFALATIPAPGTEASNKMGFLHTEDAINFILNHVAETKKPAYIELCD